MFMYENMYFPTKSLERFRTPRILRFSQGFTMFYIFLPICMMEIWWFTKDVVDDFGTSESHWWLNG